jgi:hypothetical protein
MYTLYPARSLSALGIQERVAVVVVVTDFVGGAEATVRVTGMERLPPLLSVTFNEPL